MKKHYCDMVISAFLGIGGLFTVIISSFLLSIICMLTYFHFLYINLLNNLKIPHIKMTANIKLIPTITDNISITPFPKNNSLFLFFNIISFYISSN